MFVKIVYMQECMNYTIAMLALGLHNLLVHLHSACQKFFREISEE